MGEGARIVFNLCFVKVIMKDYRFGSMAEIRRPMGEFLLIYAIFFGSTRRGCGCTPSDTSQLFLILEFFKGKAFVSSYREQDHLRLRPQNCHGFDFTRMCPI